MPVYDYACERCGPFSARAAIALFDQPAACPQCGEPSPRMLAVPQIATASPALRMAHARNERSAHEPCVVTHEQLHGAGSHRHQNSHAEAHGHTHPSPPPQARRLGNNLRQSRHRSLIGH